MSVGPGWRRLLRLTRGERSIEHEVDDELEFHLAMREEKLRRLGASANDAHARARARFGDTDRVRDECVVIDRGYARDQRFVEWAESVWADVRYAARTLRRMPAFTVVATLTLALGIGATSAMFTLVDGILLRSLPYPHADRIVRVIQSYPEKGLDTWGLSQQNLAQYRDLATDFESFAGYRSAGVTLASSGRATRLNVALVTADFFRVMGVFPSIGRTFTREEDSPGKNDVAILSDGYWQTHFAGRASVIGTTVDLDGKPTRIIGVMPPSFAFPRTDVAAWLPMGLDPTRRFGFTNAGIARLRPGVSVAHARRQTTVIMWNWMRTRSERAGTRAIPPEQTRMGTIVMPLQQAITGRTTRPLIVLLAAVSLILLIAIANVATLLSSRAATREREIGLRAALGATGARVTRQLLTESITLALLGAAAGVALAYGAVRAFTGSELAALPRINEVHVDFRVLSVTLALSLASGLLFGLLPARHAARTRGALALSGGARDGARRSVRRANDLLVVAQLALSVVLLVGAGLMLQSFRQLTSTDLGFRPEEVTAVSLPLPPRYNSAATANPLIAAVLDRVRAVPGVQSAALGWGLPFEGQSNYDGYLIEGRVVPASGNEDQTYQVGVSPGYFTTLGIPLVYGRDVEPSDDTTSIPVALVDQTLANRYWRGAGALGKRIRVTGDTTWFTIVGVVGALRDDDASTLPAPHLYVSLAQQGSGRVSLAVRTTGDGAAAIRGVLHAIGDIEPSIPLDMVRPLSSFIDQSLATRRLTQLLLAAFAAIAVLLAAIGIYGVMSLSVAERRREFGVRLAVGAAPGALVRLVLRDGARLAAFGVILGVAGALVATRWLASLLYEVSPTDPTVFVTLSLALGAIAMVACYLPARRAARADPLAALRAD